MKIVIVPEPVLLKDREGAPLRDEKGNQSLPVSLYAFLMDVVCMHPTIGAGSVGLRRINKLERSFADALPGAAVTIDEADHAAVLSIIQGISWVNPQIARQQLPIIDAWEKASES